MDRLILDVIETLHLKESEVQDNSGNWYRLRIRPYRTKENKIEGAVLALSDIDEFKRSLEQMSEVIWEPLLALDSGLRIMRANEAFYKTFGVSPGETEGRLIFDLGNGQWKIPQLRHLLEKVLPEKEKIRDFLVRHDFPNLGSRRMLLNARRMNAGHGEKELVLLAIKDVTKS